MDVDSRPACSATQRLSPSLRSGSCNIESPALTGAANEAAACHAQHWSTGSACNLVCSTAPLPSTDCLLVGLADCPLQAAALAGCLKSGHCGLLTLHSQAPLQVVTSLYVGQR